MKKCFMALGLLTISSMASAKSITCTVENLLADKAGYLMPGPQIQMTPSEKVKLYNNDLSTTCAYHDENKLKYTLCISETNMVGGYIAELSVDAGEGTPQIVSPLARSWETYGTVKNAKTLLPLEREAEVLETVSVKLREAGVDIPFFYNNSDSAPTDEAVAKGMKAQVLTPNEVVVSYVSNCKFN